MAKGQQPRSSATHSGTGRTAGTEADQHAGNRADAPGSKAREAKEKGKEKAQELKARGQEAARDVKEKAEHAVERRTSRGAEQLESVVHALEAAADRFEEEGRESLARYTRTASHRIERMSGYLREEDAGSMLDDLEDMARSNPATFLGTTFAAGVAAGRFLRSSAPEPTRTRRYTPAMQSRTTYPGTPTRTPDEVRPGELGSTPGPTTYGTTEGRI